MVLVSEEAVTITKPWLLTTRPPGRRPLRRPERPRQPVAKAPRAAAAASASPPQCRWIALIPSWALTTFLPGQQVSFSGISILIAVGVALETMKQIDSTKERWTAASQWVCGMPVPAM